MRDTFVLAQECRLCWCQCRIKPARRRLTAPRKEPRRPVGMQPSGAGCGSSGRSAWASHVTQFGIGANTPIRHDMRQAVGGDALGVKRDTHDRCASQRRPSRHSRPASLRLLDRSQREFVLRARVTENAAHPALDQVRCVTATGRLETSRTTAFCRPSSHALRRDDAVHGRCQPRLAGTWRRPIRFGTVLQRPGPNLTVRFSRTTVLANRPSFLWTMQPRL